MDMIEQENLAQENLQLRQLVKAKDIEIVNLKQSLYNQTERLREAQQVMFSSEQVRFKDNAGPQTGVGSTVIPTPRFPQSKKEKPKQDVN